MIDITSFLDSFIKVLDATFGERVWFVGLQGSYSRGEATDTSDIDIVVLLDTLSPSDIQTYSNMLDKLPQRELLCGFLSGKDEILSWDPSDLFQFYYDTTPIKGSLDKLLSLIDEDAIKRSIKIGAGNIYHGCVHNMLYEKSDEMIKGLYKGASFVLQALYFLKTGKYIRLQKDLSKIASPEDKVIVDTFLSLKRGEEVEFEKMSEILFTASKRWLKEAE